MRQPPTKPGVSGKPLDARLTAPADEWAGERGAAGVRPAACWYTEFLEVENDAVMLGDV